MSSDPLPRAVVRLDSSSLAVAVALPGAIGVALPLLIGLTAGDVTDGIVASTGALIIGFADLGGAYRARARTLLTTSAAVTVAGLLGGLVAPYAALTIAVIGAWGFAGGLLVALGRRASFVGMLSTWALLLTSDLGLHGADTLQTTFLIGAGALLQTTIALMAWPLRPLAPERRAVADAYSALADYATAPSTDALATGAGTLSSAAEIVSTRAPESDARRALLALVEQGEWIRLDLTALARVDGAATAEHGPEAADDDGEVAGVLEAAAAALDAIAVSVAHPRRVRDVDRPLAELRRRAGTIEAGQGRRAALVLVRRIDAAAARHGVDHEDTPGAAADGAVTVLLAQLTPGSSAFRHAARLAVALMVAVVAYRSLPLGRGYWVPLTVLFVLKPDHGTTFARGIGRAAGTILGLAIAWALVTTLSPSDGAVIVMLAVLTFGAYALYPANYALFSVLLTIVIALLAQFGGGSPIGALEDRLLDTALGGAIALTAFALWPTTEAASSAHRLAVLVDHQRAWLGLVLSGLADDGVREDRSALRGIRLKTRQARADAEAAVARAQAEPARRRPDRRRPSAVLAAMDRLSASTLALAAAMYEGERTSVTTLGPFARASDDCLKVVSESLESGDWRALRIPRRETAALADAAASATAEDSLATVIVPEAWLILAALEQLDRDARPALGGSGRRVGTGPVEHRGGPPATR